MVDPNPFEVRWSEREVGLVLDQVRNYAWPPVPRAPDGWSYGCDRAYLKALCEHWTGAYDWRGAITDLNRFPQYTAQVGDLNLHYVHVVGEAEGRRPLLLSHGWPGSHYEFWRLIEPLAYPSRFGGKSSDAFDLVIPSLPGFGFSSKPPGPIGPRATARLFNALMTEVLGYRTYLAQGGDWGGAVTSWLGRDHSQAARAIHLNMLWFRLTDEPATDAERAWVKEQTALEPSVNGYFRLQSSKPQSLAWLGAGNPVGQAAWIAERFHDWSDLRFRPLDEVHPKDQLLTNIMIYVMTGSFTTSSWFYRGAVEEGDLFAPGVRCETPTAFASFPGEGRLRPPPRTIGERGYNIVRWTEMPSGGHFAAMEEPRLLIDDIRAWARAHD